MEITTRTRLNLTGLFVLVMFAGTLTAVAITLIASRSIANRDLRSVSARMAESVDAWVRVQRASVGILADVADRRVQQHGGDLNAADIARLLSVVHECAGDSVLLAIVDRDERPTFSQGMDTLLLSASLEDSEAVCARGVWRVSRPLGPAGDPFGFLLVGFPLGGLTSAIDSALAVQREAAPEMAVSVIAADGRRIAGEDLPPGIAPSADWAPGSLIRVSDDDGRGWALMRYVSAWDVIVRVPRAGMFSLTPWMIGAGVLAVVFGVAIMLGTLPPLTRRLGETVQKLTVAIDAISHGDFSSRVDKSGNDDLADLVVDVNTLAESLEESVAQIEAAAEAVASAAQQILATSEEHEEATNIQSSALQETASTVEEMDVSASQASENAQEVVARTERAAQQIQTLSERAQRISKVSEVIDEVSQQIRILALSASIEAARARDAGGFSVIADEIRRLADDTSRSTSDIDALVQDVQAATAASVRTMEHTVEAVKAIGLAMSQQSVATGQITEAMSDMNAGMSEAVLFTRASVDAGEELNMMAGRLQETIGKLRNPSAVENGGDDALEEAAHEPVDEAFRDDGGGGY